MDDFLTENEEKKKRQWLSEMMSSDSLVEAIKRTQGVVYFTLDGIITDANAVFLKAMGYDLNEVIGKHHRMFMETKAAERPEYAQFWASLREGKEQGGEFKRIAKSGSSTWLSATYTPIVQDGKVVGIVKFGRVITTQKVHSVEMETQVAAINKTQAVVEFTPQGQVLHANPIFLEAMGYTLDEIVGKPHRMFMPEVLPADYAPFWQALVAGQSKAGEFTRNGKGGGKVHLQAVYTPIVLEGQVLKVIKFAQDVTVERNRTKDFECQIDGIRQTLGRLTDSGKHSTPPPGFAQFTLTCRPS
jgi:methyl-accepting chemotaxis protein